MFHSLVRSKLVSVLIRAWHAAYMYMYGISYFMNLLCLYFGTQMPCLCCALPLPSGKDCTHVLMSSNVFVMCALTHCQALGWWSAIACCLLSVTFILCTSVHFVCNIQLSFQFCAAASLSLPFVYCTPIFCLVVFSDVVVMWGANCFTNARFVQFNSPAG